MLPDRACRTMTWCRTMRDWFAMVFLGGVLTAGAQGAERIIFDTDIGNDVDDLGALVMLHALVKRGEIELLAIGLSNGHELAVPFTRLVNARYGHPEIPLGVVGAKPPVNWDHYMSGIMADHPQALANRSATDASLLYRRVLASQPDGAVTLVVVGPPTNLARLLQTAPDEISPLAGTELVRRKVKLYSAGGNGSGTLPHGRCGFNYRRDNAAARVELALMPTSVPMIFAGGSGESLVVGRFLTSRAKDDILRRGYEAYLAGKEHLDRPTWDQLRVLYACRPACRTCFTISERGRITLDEGGVLDWTADADHNHAYAYVRDTEVIREQIESLMREGK